MAHNLSVQDGVVEMAYAGKRPWHGLGVQVPGLMRTDEALAAAHLDWNVEKVPALSSFDMSVIPDTFAVLRSDNHKPLGVVGDRYTTISNKEALSYMDMVFGETQAQIETAGALGNGEKVFLLAKIPEITEVLPGDSMEQFLLASTTHDGSGSNEVLFTNVRVVCANTLNLAIRGQKNRLKIRHTTNYKEKMAQVAEILIQSKAHWSKFQEMAKHLAATSVSRVEVGMFMEKMFPKKDEAKRNTVEKARNKFLQLLDTGMGTDIPGVRGSAWGVLNSFSEYLQYGRTVNGFDGDVSAQNSKRWEKMVFGTFQDDLQKATDELLAIAA